MAISEQQLAEWERLANEATDGPWYVCGADVCDKRLDNDGGCTADCDKHVISTVYKHNAAFIAAARRAVPALIAEVRRLQPYAPVGQEFDWVNGDD